MATILDGKTLASKIENQIKKEVDVYKKKGKRIPKLATIIVGDDHASVVYVKMKQKACKRVGFLSEHIALKKETTTEELLKEIRKLNQDDSVDGILLQHPCPKTIDEARCFDEISLIKDVDGVNSHSFGKVTMGMDAFYTATTLGIKEIIEHYKIDFEGKNVVVIGKSQILGKPTAMMLLNKEATVTVAHSKTKNLKKICKNMDVIVACAGQAKLVKKDWVKKGAVIIDVGYNKGNIGDVDIENIKEKVTAYTPVPGGVGPMTIASLLKQTLIAYKKREGLYKI